MSLLAGGGRAAVINASAGVGSDGERLSAGVWTPSDIPMGAVPSDAHPPHGWCSLTTGTTCSSPEIDAATLAATAGAVDLHGAGADNDGTHSLEKPWSASPTPRTGDATLRPRRGHRDPPVVGRSNRPKTGTTIGKPVAGLCQGRFQRDCDA